MFSSLAAWLPAGHSLHLYSSVVLACSLIGLSSMISLFIFSILIHRRSFLSTTNSDGSSKSSRSDFDDPTRSEVLKLILSFAIGGLLGDVFLHLIPEAAVQLEHAGYSVSQAQHFMGFWVLAGIVTFVTVESVFNIATNSEQPQVDSKKCDPPVECSQEKVSPVSSVAHRGPNSNGHTPSGKPLSPSGVSANQVCLEAKVDSKPSTEVNITGYLNLLANSFDNFTHGVSVGASFLVSAKMGVLTTLAIAIHEIPHEIADYVILVRSGFSCWDAFRAQLSICLVTIVGSVTVIYLDSNSAADSLDYTLWILPATAGGFIYIALTSLMPELLSVSAEVNCHAYSSPVAHKLKCLTKRMAFVLLGIFVMATINTLDSK